MKDEMMQRFLNLVEKTGDKVVITDPAGEHPYVLMSLDQYEKLVLGNQAVPAPRPPQKPIGKAALESLIMAEGAEKTVTKKDISIWKSQIGRSFGETAIRETAKNPAPKAKPSPFVAREAQMDTEGEERFYLEPLE